MTHSPAVTAGEREGEGVDQRRPKASGDAHSGCTGQLVMGRGPWLGGNREAFVRLVVDSLVSSGRSDLDERKAAFVCKRADSVLGL